MKKHIHFQGVNCTKTPATRPPPAAPTGVTHPNIPIATFLKRPGGKVIPINAIQFGTMRPPPIPDMARRMHSAIKFGENPLARVKTKKMKAPINIILLCP
jgi:hypothetical protein